MHISLDIAILGSQANADAIAYARTGDDIAIEALPADANRTSLLQFRDHVDAALRSTRDRPQISQLTKFGNDLFHYVIRGSIKDVYDKLPNEAFVRLSILSNNPELQSLPWEYLQDPSQAPGPWLVRSVVRVVPTVKVTIPPPLNLLGANRKLKILFAFADPVDQDPVSWPAVKDAIERSLSARLPLDKYELTVVDASPKELTEALQQDHFDIFHFCGHGNVDSDGKGYLVFLNRVTNKTIPHSAAQLAATLRARGIRLVILSACYSAAGKFVDRFDVSAIALVNSGIPAVVANQFSVPDSIIATLVKPLYLELFQSGDIDRAVNEARLLLANDPALARGENATLEWGIPTLYRHIAGAELFKKHD